jgi:NADH dehydrogenase
MRILLIEAGPRVLGSYPEALGAYTQEKLTKLGVDVRLNTTIEHIDENGVIADGEPIDARTTIWAAGVKATPVAAWLGIKPTRHGTVNVKPDLSVPGCPNVFVIGDASHVSGADGKPLPGLAAVAKQQGEFVGKLLRHRFEGKVAHSGFQYRDYGTMATIGRSAAVADLRGFRIKGTFAWLLWGLVHIYFLIGFRNRLLVLVNWFWAWLTYARGARLITGYEPGRSLTKSRRPVAAFQATKPQHTISKENTMGDLAESPHSSSTAHRDRYLSSSSARRC